MVKGMVLVVTAPLWMALGIHTTVRNDEKTLENHPPLGVSSGGGSVGVKVEREFNS